MNYRLLFPALLAGLLPAIAFAQFEIPVNDNYVTQTTKTLTVEQEEALEQRLGAYDRATSNQIAILITESMSGADILEEAVEVGRAWGVGTSENNNGVIMLIALADREVAIQVGYGLEGALPDIVVKGIIDTDITPHFADGEYYEGIVAAVDSMEKHIGGEYTAERYTASEGFQALPGLFFFILIFGQLFTAWFARSKAWWAGGVVGGIAGFVMALLWNWWVAIPALVILGLLFDYVVSRNPGLGKSGRGRRGPWIGPGGGGFGGGSGGGGFGGFGGGSFGGGGARGKW